MEEINEVDTKTTACNSMSNKNLNNILSHVDIFKTNVLRDVKQLNIVVEN